MEKNENDLASPSLLLQALKTGQRFAVEVVFCSGGEVQDKT